MADPHSSYRAAGSDHRHVRSDVCFRLQPGQSVADGIVDCGGLRGRRRHRHGRKHRAASRDGEDPLQAALDGAAEIGFTIVSISISLVAVFIPLLLMSGMVGKMFQEFAVTVTS